MRQNFSIQIDSSQLPLQTAVEGVVEVLRVGYTLALVTDSKAEDAKEDCALCCHQFSRLSSLKNLTDSSLFAVECLPAH